MHFDAAGIRGRELRKRGHWRSVSTRPSSDPVGADSIRLELLRLRPHAIAPRLGMPPGTHDPVKLFHPATGGKTIPRLDEIIFRSPRKQLETDACYQNARANNGGSIMWDTVINRIYRRLCRNYMAAASGVFVFCQ